MLTKRDYWTITSLILVVFLLFQLINVARRSDVFDVTNLGVPSVTEGTANERSMGDEEQ